MAALRSRSAAAVALALVFARSALPPLIDTGHLSLSQAASSAEYALLLLALIVLLFWFVPDTVRCIRRGPAP